MQGLNDKSLAALSNEILQGVDSAATLDDLENLRINALGKKGRIALLMRGLGGMDPRERKVIGQLLNQLKSQVVKALEAKQTEL